MNKLLLVFFGGGVGSLARYLVGTATLRTLGPAWPYGTFTVNVLGGFVMGLLAGILAFRGGADQERWRVLIGVGMLVGFTSFSSFSLEVARGGGRGGGGGAGGGGAGARGGAGG